MAKKPEKRPIEPAPAKSAEPKYALEKLRANCFQLFGVSEPVFIGATTGLADGEYSVSEIKTTIAGWLKGVAK